jgi:rhodanese-related sulfurtransferase
MLMDITVEELKNKLSSNEDFIFIDVREPWEYSEFNLGGQLLPLGNIMEAGTAISDDKAKEIIVYCRSGQRSGMAKSILMQLGYTHVRNLLGGVMDWQSKYGSDKI